MLVGVTSLRVIIRLYQEYRDSWESSDHQPSRMVGLFLKSMRSYIRCKRAIQSHDPWHLEIESCTIMPIWKMFGKNTYLRLQCEYLETFYDDKKVAPVYREIMRANSFCVKRSGASVAFDDEIENYNRSIKKTPATPSLNIAVVRSRHVMAGERQLLRCGVHQSHEVASEEHPSKMMYWNWSKFCTNRVYSYHMLHRL